MVWGTLSSSGNPFQGSGFANDYFPPASPMSRPNTYLHQAPTSPASTNALVLYNQNFLHGLWYNEQVHGPFATGSQVNPFTPGLSPVSTVPKPSYEVEDPLRVRYPASRSADDPLNWITEDLFNVNMHKEHATQQRMPLRSQPAGR